MKKVFFITITVVATILLTNCAGPKNVVQTPKLSFENDVLLAINANCSPCHIPAKGGKKKPYDNYNNVKMDIDGIISRIEMNPGDKGFMPFRKTTKLSDSTIAVFKKWRADGLLEK